MKTVTGIAPVNIAVVKYWGKRDEDLILPINDSLSCTLSTDFMCAKTTIMASPTFPTHRFWLNGKESDFNNERLNNCLTEIRKRANPKCGDLLNWKLHICSENNFPTAAGLASSAAGYAALVSTLSALYNVEGDISAIARRGSGSACRSIYGGFVRWNKGAKPGGEDSIACQIASASHWPEMRVLILVVSDDQKKYSSTSGMKQSVLTSELLKHRAEKIVPGRVDEIIKAIKLKNFEAFAKITMQDSNQFHAICLDTYPPCFYMNDVSRMIIELVHAYNDYQGATKVAYTFDAGPNACLYLLQNDVDEVASLINDIFPSNTNPSEFIRGLPVKLKNSNNLRETLKIQTQTPNKLRYLIHTKIGEGPQILSEASEHLLGENGLPKNS
ncbi:diphosphomevalonate decarboxylase isoform X2 [Tribolium castaneum]|uniref:diphosphomevalonate decarboxylase isoform X2 n=1 Tax=Tribolium castaneum TaxID=7070 RepID=UPI0000D55897|nr:PREDICTED: diphosphomevalonate decarboxylase isoform X2 [Tribolium castaneum]|eukprot:XP_970108.1 PREDICTED: diphosphomevalonate decarboxylase isoform X2 [Tribolium castaneum]